MEVKKLIGLMEIREMQASAYFDFYFDRLQIDDLQKALDGYCERMAETFVENHYSELENEETLVAIRRHIASLGANKPHSGKRFHEALYKELKKITPNPKEKEYYSYISR